MEIIIAGVIIALAIYILYKNIKKESEGNCNCGSCSKHCPNYKHKD